MHNNNCLGPRNLDANAVILQRVPPNYESHLLCCTCICIITNTITKVVCVSVPSEAQTERCREERHQDADEGKLNQCLSRDV